MVEKIEETDDSLSFDEGDILESPERKRKMQTRENKAKSAAAVLSSNNDTVPSGKSCMNSSALFAPSITSMMLTTSQANPATSAPALTSRVLDDYRDIDAEDETDAEEEKETIASIKDRWAQVQDMSGEQLQIVSNAAAAAIPPESKPLITRTTGTSSIISDGPTTIMSTMSVTIDPTPLNKTKIGEDILLPDEAVNGSGEDIDDDMVEVSAKEIISRVPENYSSFVNSPEVTISRDDSLMKDKNSRIEDKGRLSIEGEVEEPGKEEKRGQYLTEVVSSNEEDDDEEDDWELAPPEAFAAIPCDTKENTSASTIASNTTQPPVPPREIHPLVEGLGEDMEALGNLADRTARAAAGLNMENVSDVQELLKCFGLPYMIAPREAESQCAAFEQSGIAAAVITDDSDVFLFGGRRIFRNLFTRNKDSSSLEMDDIENLLQLDRQSLIHLALLLGCDYTPGVAGVGPVHARAILAAFPGPNCLSDFRFVGSQKKLIINLMSQCIYIYIYIYILPFLHPLLFLSLSLSYSFILSLSQPASRQWVLDGKEEREGLPLAFRKSISFPPNFPEAQIVTAFAEPLNDPCPACTWGVPDLPALRAFATEKV